MRHRFEITSSVKFTLIKKEAIKAFVIGVLMACPITGIQLQTVVIRYLYFYINLIVRR